MSMEELREEACDCLFEIVNKGMDPVDKTKLVESLCQVLQSAGFFNIEQVCEYMIVLESAHQALSGTCFILLVHLKRFFNHVNLM